MCDIFATTRKDFRLHALKMKIRIQKLELYYYALVRLIGASGGIIRRREATVPLKFRPKLDKIVELLLYLAHKRPGADKYQAVKFFYLADREHFKRYGRPITFDDYYAMWYGPVASNALDLLHEKYWTMHRAGIKELPFKTELGRVKTKSGRETQTTFIREPLREVNTDIFSKSDLEVFDEVIRQYGNASFDELFEMTHEHFAYVNAWNKRGLSNRAEMLYDEMIDDVALRKSLVEDLSSVSAKM
jgi:uncharacterized phage-associated protein